MRIFQGFLLIVLAVILFMLPITASIYAYRTDLRTDTFNYETGGAEISANVTLFTNIYDNDTETITILSDLSTDSPLFNGYNTATRVLDMTGMTVSANRSLTVSYDINALIDNEAVSILMDWLPFIWIVLCCVFAPLGLWVIIAKYVRKGQ